VRRLNIGERLIIVNHISILAIIGFN